MSCKPMGHAEALAKYVQLPDLLHCEECGLYGFAAEFVLENLCKECADG